LGLAAVARVPVFSSALPPLRAFSGDMGIVVIVVAVLSAIGTALPWSKLCRISSPVLFLFSACVSAGVGLYYIQDLQATGDEPEYLLLTQSLWKEHDLDVVDNWKRGDFLEYVPGMQEAPAGTIRKDGRPISTHSPGLPLLLAPIYAMGGRRLCVVALALAGAALAVLVRALALQMTGQPEAALLAWGATVGAPVFYYTFHLYTEVPSALFAALALRLLLAAPGPLGAGIAALLIAALPWLHVKMIPLAAVLGAVAVVRLRGRARGAFVVIGVVMALLYVAYYWRTFGTLTPLGLYRGRVPKGVRYALPFSAAFGIFIDRVFGIVPCAPIWLLGVAALGTLARRWRATWPYLLYAVAVIAPILTWRAWTAGCCPPARFLVPVVPVLAVALAMRAAGTRYGLARWTAPLLVTGYVWIPLVTRNPGDLCLLHAKHDPPHLFSALMGLDVVLQYLPSFTFTGNHQLQMAVIWSVVFVAVLVLDALAERRRLIDRLFASPAFPIGVWILVGLTAGRGGH
jgi:hypothetical protein